MAKKNFATMTSKKLNALLETANEADAAEIKKVLESRGQMPAAPAAEEAPAETAETAAPAAEEAKPETPAKEVDEAAEAEARDALAAELKEKHVNHKCKVVPFGQIEFVEGTITGVMHDKRNKKVMYIIRLADGRRIFKVYNAQYLEILDEVNTEAPVSKRGGNRSSGTKKELDPNWDANAEAEKHYEHVGKLIEVDENTDARITAIVPDKRSQRILYRAEYVIMVDDKEETKTIHKTSSDELIAALKSDDQTAELNAKYLARKEAAATRTPSTPKTPEEKLADIKARIEKVEETLAKLRETEKELTEKIANAGKEQEVPAAEEAEELA